MSQTEEDPFATAQPTGGDSPPPGQAPAEEDPFAATDNGNKEAQMDNPNRVQSESFARDESHGGNESDTLAQEESVYAREGENPLQPHHHESRGGGGGGSGPENSGAEDDPFATGGGGFGGGGGGGDDPPPLGGFGNQPGMESSQTFERKNSLTKSRSMKRTASRGPNQPNLHEVVFENKANKRRSLASSMLSNRHRGGYNDQSGIGQGTDKGDPEDPFANFGGGDGANPDNLARSNSLSGSHSMGQNRRSFSNNKEPASFGRHASMGGPQIVSGGGGHHDPAGRESSVGISSEDRHNAENPEELFMPNMKREQFIPVRVARDKIKHVLSEMASMKAMHLAALDTMEKQHAFLKAQLESATATYVKKLTGDYNNRVTALEAEYKRRLDNLNSNAMHDVDAGVDEAKRKVEKLEEKMMKKVKDREAELEHEQKMFRDKIANDNAQREKEREEMRENEAKMEEMILKVKELEMKLAMSQRNANKSATASPAPQDNNSSAAAEAKVGELEGQVSDLKEQLHKTEIQRKALEQQAAQGEEDALNLKLANSKIEKLEQENAEMRAKLGGTPPPA